jgi:hypothetical protein
MSQETSHPAQQDDTVELPPTAADTLAEPPVPGEDLAKEMKRAGEGFGKVTIGLVLAVIVAFSFGAGAWVNSFAGSSSASTPSQGGQGRGGQGTAQQGGNGQGQLGQGQGGFGQGRQGGRGGTAGTIDHVDGNTVYVKTPQGNEVQVSTSDSTTISLARPGQLSDLAPGSTVTVQGQTGSDGKVDARAISQQPAN